MSETTPHKHQQETWALECGVELERDVVGTKLTHYYDIPWLAPVASVAATGAAMPDRPASGLGALATVVTVMRVGTLGTSRRIVQVVGFEPDVWSDT